MLSLRALKKSIAMLLGIAMIVTLFAGFTMTSVSAADAEKIYNIASLSEVPDYKGAALFDGAVEYKAAESKGVFGDIDGVSVTTPGGQQITLGQSIRVKGIEAAVTLDANETMIVYYRGADSKGAGKDITMVIKDSNGSNVATDSNSENKSSDIFEIAYKSTTGGKYTFAADNYGSVRSELYAIVVTPYDYRDPSSAEKLPPNDIGNFTAEAGDGMVVLKWDAVPYAESYNVYENGEIVAEGITDTTYTSVGLDNGTEYTYKLEAVNSAGKKEKTVTATPKESTDPPQEFTLSGSGRDNGAALSWTTSKNAKTYSVYRNGVVIKSDLSAATLTYADSGLTNGTEYTYKVVAKNNYGEAASNEVKVTPEAPPLSKITIADAAGWLESAYVKWTNTAEVDKYNVYVAPEGGAYTKIDDELVRYYGNYYRADALGLKAGQYRIKVAAEMNGVETEYVETDVLNVTAHTREGFAFDPSSSYYDETGIGAYKMDGTLKDGAQVLYIDDTNKDTVEFTVNIKGKPTTANGLVNILALREKNGAEDTPLAIRMIGQVESPEGKNSAGYVQIKACKNITFEGVGDDATTFHWSFLLRSAQNVEVRNIAVMEFYDDGISLDTDNYNCWVHNCDIFYGQDRGGDQKKGDGSLDVKSGSDYCTFSFNHFWDSGKSSLCGMKNDSYKGYHITYHHNWFDHSDSRHPRIRGDQVHIYNNYYDGNSKYGVGVTTGGSAFVERNVFRNVKYPMLISMQGSDVHGENEGTFSGEAGGMIKAYDNDIQRGSQSQTFFTQNEPESDGTIDAYVVTDKSEKVPESVTTKSGNSSYSNFDTSSNMYKYESDPVSVVVTKVETYAGRVQGGDFKYEFDDATADSSYDRLTDLGDRLKNYKTTLKYSYTSPASYPATDGSAPEPGPTTPPIPTAGPTLKPGETPAPTNTPTPTQAPIMANPTVWDFGMAPFTVTDGDAVHPDTKYFPAGSVKNGKQQYSLKSDSIAPENFGGLRHTTGKSTEDQYQPSSAEFTDGFKGTWQIKSNGGSFSFIPVVEGTVKVYARHGSSGDGKPDDNITIVQGGNSQKETIASTASAPYPVLTMNVVANQTVTVSADQNTGYYAIAYTSDKPVPTTPPATSTPLPSDDNYAITDAALGDNGINVTVTYSGSAPAPGGVLIAAKYDANGALTDFKQGPSVNGAGTYTVEGFKPSADDNYRIYLWNSLDGMKPLCDAYINKSGAVSTTEPTQR